jgi:long-chain-fatty-acid--CoA ligase ACSBG
MNVRLSFYSGAAPISEETLHFFLSLDMKIFEIYGLSETNGPQTISCHESFKLGSAGKTLPGTKTK